MKTKVMVTLLVAFAAMVASTPAASITFSGPVDAGNTSVLDVEINLGYTFVEGVTYGSGAKTFTTAGGNTIALAGDSGTGLGNVDMPAATPSATSGYYNAGTQWVWNGTPDTDKIEWTDALKGNLWASQGQEINRPLTLHLAGLTVGQAYSVQLYSADARFTDREQAYAGSFTGGVFSNTSASFSQNPAYKVTGTFVADDVYQDIFVQATDTAGWVDTTLAVYTLYAVTGPNVSDPNPSNGESNVDIAKILSWSAPSDPNFDPAYTITYDIYVDPNAAKVAAASGSCQYTSLGQTAVTFDPTPDLSYSTPYYWAVNAHIKYDYKTEPNVLSGPVWSFTTIAEEPSVNPVSPALTVVDAGEPSVVLSVTGTNIMSYQWYKEGVGVLSNGADYAGVDTATLTIYDVQLADEGYYYCEVANLVGTDVSEPGLVMTRRLIIHYPLDTTSIVDGNEVTPDIVGGFDMTLVSGAVQGTGDGTDFPTLVTDDPNVKIGTGAMLFNNSNSADPNNAWGQYTTAGDVDMEAMGDGLTVSFWAQWIGNNTQWQGIINRENSWNAADMMWRVDKDPTSGVISLGRNGAVQAETTLIQNQWNFITFTVSSTGVVKAYNNGELISTVTGFSYGSGVNSSFKLGSADGGAGFFWGIVDDVKIYNYARTTEQVANDYLDVVGGWVCNNEGTVDLTYDFNDNCLVDLADFAMFAADWLNSNRIVAP